MRHLSTLLIIILAFACQGKHEISNDLNEELIINEIQQMFDDYHKDIRLQGLTGELKYLDNSKDFFWVPPGYNSALSYDSVKTILEKNAKAFSRIEFQWDTLRIIPISNEVASYSGIVEGTMIDTSGIKSMMRIIESGTVIKRTTEWKLLCGQSANLSVKQ
ncbi:hypothetical protein [Flagellimonas sp. CMM7]|uniref:hypothetical protein n=1 Tax=Flagellimonas sp. CMM7 TaxID=2654676 RepID=UPI0013D14A10|nr:hypothetical protein [Flagellimonas sp. CMM7]UII81341.1 hypothetical protein LV704_07440 [Flagellimonas sp. CMM7]